jgi:hypothetical protein
LENIICELLPQLVVGHAGRLLTRIAFHVTERMVAEAKGVAHRTDVLFPGGALYLVEMNPEQGVYR